MKENIVNKLAYNIKKIGDSNKTEFIKYIKKEYDLEITDFYLYLIKMCDFGIEKVLGLNKNSSEKHAMTLKTVKINICKLIDVDMNSYRFLDEYERLFPDTLFLKIEACADFISDNVEVVIDENKISELLKETQNLIEEIKESTIDNNMKKILLLQLSGVYDSLSKYSLFGYEEVELSVKMTIGAIIMNLKKDADKMENNFIARSLRLMATLNTAFSFAKNANDLIGACVKLLPDQH